MQASTIIPRGAATPPVSPLSDELSAIFDVIDDEPLLAMLAQYRWTGRPGWSLRALWRAYLAAYALGLPTTNALVRRLQEDIALRGVCGFYGELPSRWTFNRFTSRLSHHTDLLDGILASLTTRLHELLPDFGSGIAVDASTVRSWSNPNRQQVSDPEATFTAKKNAAGKQQWYWGFKLHLAVDARYELPIAATFTTASTNDLTQFQPVLDKARALYPWLRPSYVTADRGYDAIHAHEYVVKDMQAVSIIHMRKMRKTEPNDFADWDGTPLCLGGQAMTFLGYTPDLKLKYRCPTGGCQLKDRQGVLYCDTELVVDPLDDLRRFSLVPRNSPQWSALYSTRQSVERCFSRLKQHRALNDHCRRGLRKVALHSLMGLISIQASAVARATKGDAGGLRRVTRRVA